MDSALGLHRFHFAFTVTYHYLFPQLTMGLALLIFLMYHEIEKGPVSQTAGAAGRSQ